MHSARSIGREAYDAVLFDLDGVLTATAKVHAVAWKGMFDEFLKERAAARGEDFVPFDVGEDYRLYVDGKPRFDGVRSFLAARGITLPDGDPDSAASMETLWGLGNRKNTLVNEVMASDGVEVFPGSIRFVNHIRALGMKAAVVSSSQNCLAVLQAAKIESLFDVRVDGQVAMDLDLPGKPDPEMFLAAARRLGIEPRRGIVVEDAIVGVQAGRDGHFGLVVGIARKGDREALLEHGADIVVEDLAELLPAA